MPDYRARIDVMLKPLVNDPQGLAVRDGLQTLGFEGVATVRVGKHIEVTRRGGFSRPRPSRPSTRCATASSPTR